MIKRKRGEEGRVRREEERAQKGSQCSCLTGNDDSDDQNNLGGEEEEEEDRQLDSPKYATSGKPGVNSSSGRSKAEPTEPRPSYQLY